MRKYSIYFITLFVIVFDQITKILIRKNIPLYDSISIIGDYLRFTHVENTGAAFSFSFGSVLLNRIIFIIVTLVAVVFIVAMINKTKSKLQNICFSLILGGAIGNLIDRIIFGRVTDFLDTDFPDFIMHRWPVFNIADSSIVIAITLFFINEIFIERSSKKQTELTDIPLEDK